MTAARPHLQPTNQAAEKRSGTGRSASSRLGVGAPAPSHESTASSDVWRTEARTATFSRAIDPAFEDARRARFLCESFAYQQYGDSCAGRQPQGTGAYCADVFGATPVQSTATSAATAQPAPVLTTSATSPSGAVDLEAIAEAWRTPELAELKLFAPNSPAFTFFEGLFLLRQFDPFQAWVDPPIEVRGDTLVHAVLGTTIGRFVVDETGLVSDFERNGVAISRTVYRIGLIVEGVDEGEGVTGTVHSVRYFDGNLQVVTLTANNGDVDAVLTAEEFVGENRQIVGVIPETLLRHGITGATVNIFEDAPTSGGTLYGSLWAGGTAVIGWNVDVPALGDPQPAPPTTES